MFVELHLLQSFAPSCLNRDDTNTPKDCVFGGVRRARISSQCIKRAIRTHAGENGALKGRLGTRSKRLHGMIVDALVKREKDPEEAAQIAELAVKMMKLKFQKSKKDDTSLLTQYLVFMGSDELEAAQEAILSFWDDLLKMAKSGKEPKSKDIPKELAEALNSVFQGKKAADLALFGRMLADMPDRNIDAACQVAHAISTHKVEMEMDFYTAVDDLKPEDTSGADMMGTVEFNSACFYRYAVLHWDKLLANLGQDMTLAQQTVQAFLEGAIQAIPTGKQNTFAAHNPPCLVSVLVRDKGAPWSLANAFERPVRANGQGLVAKSMTQLNSYRADLVRMYGDEPLKSGWVALDKDVKLDALGKRKDSVPKLITEVLSALPEAKS